MRSLFICFTFLFICYTVTGQNDFTGMAKYKITVEGSNHAVTDSMMVVFNKQKVKVTLYLPDAKDTSKVSEQVFIDDFSAKKSFILNTENKTYRVQALNTSVKYDFINTTNLAISNNLLCFQYKADSTKLNTSNALSVNCIASIAYKNSRIKNYFFLGIQPIIIDNRIVMDFIVTQRDGKRPRTYIADITEIENVDNYFNLNGYKQVQ